MTTISRPAARRAAALLLLTVFCGLLSISPGLAAQASDSPSAAPVEAPDADAADDSDSSTAARGRLLFDRQPVVGAQIEIIGDDAEVLATTDEDGRWVVELPSTGDYTATLLVDTLPDGVSLRDEGGDVTTFSATADRPATVSFRLGEGAVQAGFATRFSGAAINGVKFGLVIAAAAIGLSLIFSTTGLVNFAHGELVTIGAVLAWFANSPDHWGGRIPLVVGAIIAMAGGAAVGGILNRGLFQPLRRARITLVQQLVVSIGLALVLRSMLQLWFGVESRTYLDFNLQTAWEIGGVFVTPRTIGIIVAAAASLVATGLFLTRTRLGTSVRAVSDNPDLAASSGINVGQTMTVVWVLGASLAALGGVLAGLDQDVESLLGFRLLLLVFAGVVLGGLGTVWGAAIGSLIVGLSTELSTLFISPQLKNASALALLILILLVRPQGLFGTRARIG